MQQMSKALTKSSSSETTAFFPFLFPSNFLPGVLENSVATPPTCPSVCWCNFFDDRDAGERTPFTQNGSESEPLSCKMQTSPQYAITSNCQQIPVCQHNPQQMSIMHSLIRHTNQTISLFNVSSHAKDGICLSITTIHCILSMVFTM